MYFGWFDYTHHKSAQYSKQKGFAHLLLILILFLILLVAVGLLYFQMTSKPFPENLSEDSQGVINLITPKSEPKIYSSSEFGISFEYPKEDFSVVEESEEEFNIRGNGQFRKNFTGYVGYAPGKALGSVVVLDESKDFDTAPFSVWVFNNPDNLDPESWFDKYWYYPYIWGDFTSRANLIAPTLTATVSGQLGGYNIADYREGKPQFILVPYNDKMYLFKFPTKGKPKVVGEILESFKFLQSSLKNNDELCIQVITPAKDPKTGECKEFPTPCDVPEGWEKVGSCSSELPEFLE